MHGQPSGAGDPRATDIAEQDARDQAQALREVLFIYPETMTLEELVRELTVGSTELPECDRVKRAVRDLVAGGLLHRIGGLVLPTRAAVHFSTLIDV